jgi:hypothetical protein
VRRTLSSFPDVVQAEVDLKKQQAFLQVRPSFDQYVALEEAVQEGGGAIRMFHTRYLIPQPVYACLGVMGLDADKLDRLEQRLKAVHGVRAAFIDEKRWYTNEQGLDVGGAVIFAEPNPRLEPALIRAAEAAGFVLEPRMHAADETAGRQWSEMNHAVAGLFLLFLTALAVLQIALPHPPAFVRYGTVWVWAAIFLFLFVRADADGWPLGPLSWWEGFRDRETLQHRLGIALLLPVMLGDFMRIRHGWTLNPSFTRWGILAIGAIGSGMLFTHLHTTLEPAHAAMIRRMNAQHLAMAAAVLGLAVSKFAWDTWRVPRGWGQYLWLLCLGFLGLLLNLYVE